MPTLARFICAQHMGRHAGSKGKVAPARPSSKLGLVVAQVKQPAAAKAGVLAAFARKSFPERKALRRNRQFPCVAVLLPAPAPVPAGLLGADKTFFDKGDFQAALREVISSEYADDAAADDDGVSRFRQVRRCRYLLQRGGHGLAPYSRPNLPWPTRKRCQTGLSAGISCCSQTSLQLFLLSEKHRCVDSARSCGKISIAAPEFYAACLKKQKGFRT